MDLVLAVVLLSIFMIMLVMFVAYQINKMAKQLEPDAHLKGVKTVLIEGEVLDVIVGDVLEYIPDRVT